jgi:methyl-accepting chemotaxis protein
MAQSAQTTEAAQAIAAAVAQIDLAVREVKTPVEELGLLIDQMSTGLGTLRTARRRSVNPDVVAVFPDEFDRAVDKLQKQVNGSITQLQFYDRLVQHLKHVQDYLSGAAGELASRSTEDPQALDIWNGLRDRLRTRLISEAQRQLLDVMLPPPEGADFNTGQARDELAAQGSVELF